MNPDLDMASQLLLLVQLISHLKKSFLQYSFPSREKHLSVKVHLQSQHWTHLMCHGLSRTLSRNRSTMGFSQLAQYSISCLQVVAAVNPPENTTKATPSRSPHESKASKYIKGVASSAASRGCFRSSGSATIHVRPRGTAARRTAAFHKQHRGHAFFGLLLLEKKMLPVSCRTLPLCRGGGNSSGHTLSTCMCIPVRRRRRALTFGVSAGTSAPSLKAQPIAH